jgi:hypothetical protein
MRTVMPLIVSGLLAGCGLFTGPPQVFQRTIERGGVDVTVTVVDDGTLVRGIGAEATHPRGFPPGSEPPYGITMAGRPDELVVLWISQACSTEPLLRLTADQALLIIDPREGDQPCDAMAVPNSVTIQFNREVEPNSIEVRMAP